jgi:hypothetical protein
VKKIVIISFLFLLSCSEPDNKPERLLSKEQMINILTDIHIAEAKANRSQLRSYDSIQVYYKSLEKDVFKKYGVDTTVYKQSYAYYLEHMEVMDEIYTAVVDTLNMREAFNRID